MIVDIERVGIEQHHRLCVCRSLIKCRWVNRRKNGETTFVGLIELPSHCLIGAIAVQLTFEASINVNWVTEVDMLTPLCLSLYLFINLFVCDKLVCQF